MVLHPSFLKAPSSTPPRVVFEEVFADLLAAQEDMCARIGGRYAFVVDDAGAWTLDFDAARVFRGPDPLARVTVRCSAADFDALLRGRLELNRLNVDGDPAALGAIAALVPP